MLATQDNSVVISTQTLCKRIPISHLIQEDDVKVDIKETKFDFESLDQAMFCASFSFWYAVQLLPRMGLFLHDEDMNNPLLIHSLLNIISLDINGNTNSIRNTNIYFRIDKLLHWSYYNNKVLGSCLQ